MKWLKNRHLSILNKVSEETGISVNDCAKAITDYCELMRENMGKIDVYDPNSFPILSFPRFFTLVPVCNRLENASKSERCEVDPSKLLPILKEHRLKMSYRRDVQRAKLKARPNNIFNEIRERNKL